VFARETTGKLGTFNPGFNTKPFNEDYRSKGTLSQLPLGYDTSKGQLEIHHVMGLQGQLRPLIQGLSENEQIGIMNRLLSKGVNLGNDPYNLIALLKNDHRAVHKRMEEVGLDANNEKEKVDFLNKVAGLPYKDRLIAADVFAEHIYPGIIEQMHSLGHNVPTQAQNIARYNQSVANEKRSERQAHVLDTMKGLFGEKPTMENINKVVEAPMDRLAGEAMRLLAGGSNTGRKSIDDRSQGNKNVTINAENVYMERAVNGNGNGKKR